MNSIKSSKFKCKIQTSIKIFIFLKLFQWKIRARQTPEIWHLAGEHGKFNKFDMEAGFCYFFIKESDCLNWLTFGKSCWDNHSPNIHHCIVIILTCMSSEALWKSCVLETSQVPSRVELATLCFKYNNLIHWSTLIKEHFPHDIHQFSELFTSYCR